MPAILDEHKQWVDTSGKPLVGGNAYFGDQGADPKVSPQDIFSDRDFTTPIANPQPLDADGRTSNKVWIKGRYSITVDDINGAQQYQELDNGEPESVGTVTIDNVQGATDITGTGSPTVTAYVDKTTYIFKTVSINGSPVTLDWNGVGSRPATFSDGGVIPPAQWAANQNVEVIYNASSDSFIFEQLRKMTQAEGEAGTGVIASAIAPEQLRQSIESLWVPAGYHSGLTLSNNATDATNDIDISIGLARNADDDGNLELAAAVGKQIDVTWAVGGTPGTPTGGLSAALTLTNDTWYAVHLILVSGVTEVGFDTSDTAANLIATEGATKYRRIGWVRRATALNRPFLHIGNEIRWQDGLLADVNNATQGTTSVTYELDSTPPMQTKIFVNGLGRRGTGNVQAIYIRHPDATDVAPNDSGPPGATMNASLSSYDVTQLEVFQNATPEIAARADGTFTGGTFALIPLGWVDNRDD